jgi:hypothetical protein
MGDNRNAYKALMGKYDVKRPLGTWAYRWENSNEGDGGVDSSG